MKIISGGQTGVDQAGLRAGKVLGLETGGHMPKGFRTQSGPRPDFQTQYGVSEDSSENYQPRTLKNVQNSDATLIMGNEKSPGSKLTITFCKRQKRPYLVVPRGTTIESGASLISIWLAKIQPKILNVAGNREEGDPGIGEWAETILRRCLTK